MNCETTVLTYIMWMLQYYSVELCRNSVNMNCAGRLTHVAQLTTDLVARVTPQSPFCCHPRELPLADRETHDRL